MESFKQWMAQHESTARKRAAMDPGIPPRADLVFAKPPYSANAFCRKIKAPGVRLDNMNTDNLCKKKK